MERIGSAAGLENIIIPPSHRKHGSGIMEPVERAMCRKLGLSHSHNRHVPLIK